LSLNDSVQDIKEENPEKLFPNMTVSPNLENVKALKDKKSKSTKEPKVKVAKVSKEKKPKKDKDPNAPKKALSAYIIFFKENHVRISATLPKGQKLATAVGNEWKAVVEGVKNDYLMKAKEDKDRFERELALYKETPKVVV
jgi:hydroxymethylpyrimidine/phosphomethylpyrimidine kinase